MLCKYAFLYDVCKLCMNAFMYVCMLARLRHSCSINALIGLILLVTFRKHMDDTVQIFLRISLESFFDQGAVLISSSVPSYLACFMVLIIYMVLDGSRLCLADIHSKIG